MIRITSRTLICTLTLLALSTVARADTLNVPSASYPTIQAALNAANSGDTVAIAPGTYTGPGNVDLDFGGKNLIVEGTGGAVQTIIDCQGSDAINHTGFIFHSGETSAAVVQGLTITNADATGDGDATGGGIYVTGSGTDPTIIGCVFTNNVAIGNAAGGIQVESGGAVTVSYCLFSGNGSTSSYGGGINVDQGSIVCTNCAFFNNVSHAVYGAGGLSVWGDSTATITNCSFTANSGGEGAAVGVGGDVSDATKATLTNCILYGNTGFEFGGNVDLFLFPTTDPNNKDSLSVSHSDVGSQYGAITNGGANVSADPLFVDAANGDLHLQPNSPCINAGSNAAITAPPFRMDPTNTFLVDLDGNPRVTWSLVDLGAYEFQDIPAPTLSSISPTAINAGGPAFTLTATSSTDRFMQDSTINWNGTALPTTFVSPGKLKATVPASSIASPGKAKITVVTPGPGGGTSTAKTLTIKQTSISMTLNSLVENGTSFYAANVTLTNAGYLPANNLTITVASLGAASTADTLPIPIGNLAAGASISGTLLFPASAGAPGAKVTLKVVTKFTAGSSSNSLKVVLP